MGPLTEIGERSWRLRSELGGRNVFMYLLASADGALALIDTGTATMPHEVVLPSLRRLGFEPTDLELVVVTHPDLDHQGGLAAVKAECERAVAACGFADKPMVSEPEKLLNDRYLTYEREHGLSYPPDEIAWMRANYGGPVGIESTFSGGETIRLGERELEVVPVPGHSHGHLALFESATGTLFCSDAIHGSGCPGANGSPALCPTYEEIDEYLATIDRVEALAPTRMHSGHWPEREGAEVGAFLAESREFVAAVDAVVTARLADGPATLADLCDRVAAEAGPWLSEPGMLMFAVSGHLRRLVRGGSARAIDPQRSPRTYAARPDTGLGDELERASEASVGEPR